MTDTKPLPDEVSLREAVEYFDSFLEFRQVFSRVPGIQSAVYAGGEVVLSTAHGHADVEAGVALTSQHLFRIASHSKTFTATAVLQLVEAGRLRLDDTAGQWLPELAATPAAAVTVRELLSHASGLYRDSRDGDFWQLRRLFPDRDGLVEMLRDDNADVLPANDRFKYSNVGYSLLGLIIEAVTGSSYAEVVSSGIIDRLGLTDMGSELDPGRSNDYANGYSAVAYAPERRPIEHVDTRAMAPATGFYATASDLVRYFSGHFYGDDRLLSDGSKRIMQNAVWTVGQGADQYGLGLALSKVGERELIGHGGGYPGHITRTLVDPRAGLAISVLTNCIDGPAETLAQTAIKLIDLAGAKPRPADDQDVSRFAGRFASLWGVVDIAVLGGRLYQFNPTAADPCADAIELEFVDEQTLKMLGANGYGSYGEPVEFVFNDDGSVLSMRGGSGATLVPVADFAIPDRVSLASEAEGS